MIESMETNFKFSNLKENASAEWEYRRGRRYFWSCWALVGSGPAAGPTKKKKDLVQHLPVRWGEQQIPQSGVIYLTK